MAWRRPGDKPLSDQWWLVYRRIFASLGLHDDVMKWKHFPRYRPFVRGIHRSPVNSPHKGQWRGALMFSLIYVWISGWVNNREAGDLRRHRAHFGGIVMNELNLHWKHDVNEDSHPIENYRCYYLPMSSTMLVKGTFGAVQQGACSCDTVYSSHKNVERK